MTHSQITLLSLAMADPDFLEKQAGIGKYLKDPRMLLAGTLAMAAPAKLISTQGETNRVVSRFVSEMNKGEKIMAPTHVAGLPYYTNANQLPNVNWLQKKLISVGGSHGAFVPGDGGSHSFFGPAKINPKVLAHEVGHWQDLSSRFGSNNVSRVNTMQELAGAGQSPLKPQSPKYWAETRAWDKAGIPPGDSLREAALDTYRAADRNARTAPWYALTSLGGVLASLARASQMKRQRWRDYLNTIRTNAGLPPVP